MTGCTYCGTIGCEWETCPERLEDRHGVPSDYDDEGQLKTDGGQSVADLKERFEMSCNLFVSVVPDAHLEGMLATLISYRDFVRSNIEQAGPVQPQKFVAWMESAERDPDKFPEPWGADLVETFDGLLIRAVEQDNVQPGTVVDALDEWVEETKEEVKEHHDLPADFFEEVHDREVRTDGGTSDGDYRCSYCGRELASLDETCDCGNSVGVLDL